MSWNTFPERYNFATIKLEKGKKFLVEFCFTCAELRSSETKPNPQPPRYLLSRGAAPSHSPFPSVQESFWWEKVHHHTGSYWRRWGDGPLLPTPLGPRGAPSPGEGSGHGIWDTPGGGEPPSCLRKSHSTVSHRGTLAATQQVQSGLLQSNDSTLGKGETFGLRTRRIYCRGLCPGCASRFPSRMTGPGTKGGNYLQPSLLVQVHSTCTGDSRLLVGAAISGLFVLNFQFDLLNPSLPWLTLMQSHTGASASVLCFEDKWRCADKCLECLFSF